MAASDSSSGGGKDPVATLAAAAVAAGASIATAELTKNTTTDTTGNTSGNTSSTRNTTQDSQTSAYTAYNENMSSLVESFNSVLNTTTTDNNSSQTTQNFADPDVIASMKQLAATATANSNDSSKTNGLIAGILQNAGDSLAGVFGTQNQAGIYGGATAGAQRDATLARATADAASAVLGYQTTEQGIAGDALSKLLQATAGTTTNSASHQTVSNEQDTTNSATTATDTQYEGISDSDVNVTTNEQDNSTTQQTNVQTGSSSKGSLICTWMVQNGKLDRVSYVKVTRHFLRMNRWKIGGYQMLAAPLVSILERDHTTRLSRAILWLFTNRTAFVCAGDKNPVGKKSMSGALAVAIVACLTLPFGLYLFSREVLFNEQPELVGV